MKEPPIGHCFDQLFAGAARMEVIAGPAITTCAALRRAANSHKNPFSTGTFGIIAVVYDGGPAWHVIGGSLSPAACLDLMDKTSRVGVAGESAATAADVSRQVHETAERPVQSATEIRSGAVVMRRRVHISFLMGVGPGSAEAFTFNPMDVPRVYNMAKWFESVRLVAASFEIAIDASSTAKVGIGMTPRAAKATGIHVIRSMSHNMVCYGKDDGPHVSVWDMPVSTHFARECKMVRVGNPSPNFAFYLAAHTGQDAEVNGFFELEFAGDGGMAPVRLKVSGDGSLTRRLREVSFREPISSCLPPSVRAPVGPAAAEEPDHPAAAEESDSSGSEADD